MRFVFLAVILILAVSGCGKPRGKVLGKAPSGEAHNVLSIRAGTTPPKVTITGVMVEKCPTSGCWFYLRDSTGVIKVDTKSAGFVVTDVSLETKMTVAGKVVTEGDEVQIEATGLRY